MALKWKGRVRETTVTTGTGALTLAGAVTAYGTFASLMSTGDTCYGTVAHRTTTEWEDCLFTMESDGTLTRTTVIDGSSGVGVAVSLSAGTKDVFLGLPPAIIETLLGASLVTLGTASYITSERVLTAGSGISLTDGGAGSTLTVANTAQGVTDHGALSGLTDDDHTQYALLLGRATGQTIIGGTASGDDLTLKSTSHATKGTIFLGTASAYDEVNDRLGIGNTAPSVKLHVTGADDTTARIRLDDTLYNVSLQVEAGNLESLFNTTRIVASGAYSKFAIATSDLRRLAIQTNGYVAIAPNTNDTDISTVQSRLHVQDKDSATTTVTNVLTLDHHTSGTAANGFGLGIGFRLQSSTATQQNAGLLSCSWTDATHASRTSKLTLSAYYTSTAQEGIRVQATSAGVNVGYGGPPAISAPHHFRSINDGGAGYNTSVLWDVPRTAGAASLGYGSRQQFRLNDDQGANNPESCAKFDFIWADITHATRTGRLIFGAYYVTTGQDILTLTANSAGVASSTAVFTGIPSAPFGSGARNERFGAGSGRGAATGADNTCVGSTAGSSLTNANNNTLIGSGAGAALTSGGGNVLIGLLAGNALTTASSCTLVGTNAGPVATGSLDALGTNAGAAHLAGAQCVYVGSNAGLANTSGSYNTFVGSRAGYGNQTSNGVTCVGQNAGQTITGGNNTSIGQLSGAVTLTSGTGNTLLGQAADTAATSTTDGVALGRAAICASAELALSPYITAQTFYGLSSTSTLAARAAITPTVIDNTHASRTYGVSIGAYYTSTAQEILTLTANSAGVASSTAVFTGRPSAPFGSGTNCERFGAGSGISTASGNSNTGFGSGVLDALTTGGSNTGIGYNALGACQDGGNNCAFGVQALLSLTSGTGNMGIGLNALNGITTTSNNVGVGVSALATSTGFSDCVGIGFQCLTSNTGNHNVGVGTQALLSGPCTGAQNIGVGTRALQHVTSGASNIGIGYQAGRTTLTTGGYNVLLGDSSNVAASGTNYGVALGYQAVCVANEFALGPYITAQTFYGLSSTSALRAQGKIKNTWGVSTDASREGILSLYATDYNGDRLGLQITGDGTNTEIGFYGVTPVARPSAYTQTYSTADKTHANFTAADLTVADGAGTNDATIGAITADASVIAAVQELADQHNKLKADLADLKQFVNSLVDDLQSLGLAQ